MQILLTNTLLYIAWLAFTWWKDREVTVYLLLVMLFTAVAALGAYTVSMGIYQDTFGSFGLDKLTLTPYIYCFLTNIILLQPFRYLHITIDEDSFLYSQTFKRVVYALAIYLVIYGLIRVSEAVASINMGLADAYNARHIDGETLFKYDNFVLAKIVGYGTFLTTAAVPIIMCYALIGASEEIISYKESFILTAICLTPQIANAIAMGSRGGMFMCIFCFCFFVILLKDYLTEELFATIGSLLLSALVVVLVYSWAITIGRTDESGLGGINSILRYFGEPFPNLGTKFWDKVLIHPMGMRLFPNIFNSQVDGSTHEINMFWEKVTGVPVLNFKTFFGDLFIEFGTVGAFIFTTIYSTITCVIIKFLKIGFIKLPFIYYYFQLCVYAFAGMTKTGHHATFELLIITIIVTALYYLQWEYKNYNLS